MQAAFILRHVCNLKRYLNNKEDFKTNQTLLLTEKRMIAKLKPLTLQSRNNNVFYHLYLMYLIAGPYVIYCKWHFLICISIVTPISNVEN